MLRTAGVLPAFTLLLAACVAQPTTFAPGQACVTPAFAVSDDFSGARRGRCTVLADHRVRLEITPESSGYINDSAWYAFRLEPAAELVAKISLHYQGGHHRYWPKISTDGSGWAALDPQHVDVSVDRDRAVLRVPLGPDPVWIAAQELITPVKYDSWIHESASSTDATLRTLGRSTAGLPIRALDSNPDAPDVLLLLGRQHPPEVSGAVALFAFAETVLGDTPLAREFRSHYRVITIPLLNPDGVIAGHWRHNLAGVDLNRDWGTFEQPETKLVARLLDELDAGGARLRMFIDFHSTKENTFYAPPDGVEPHDFTHTWLANTRARVTDYPFTIKPGPSESAAIAKNYIYTRYGIPAITFEVGDETDRDIAKHAARLFAEELMRLMLEQED